MEIKLDLYSLLLILSVGQFLLGVFFVARSFKASYQNVIKISFLISLIGMQLEVIMIRTELLLHLPYLLYFGPIFMILSGPLYFLYVNTSFKRTVNKWYLHLVIPFIVFVSKLPLLLQDTDLKKTSIENFYETDASTSFHLTAFLFQTFVVVYVLIGLVTLIKGSKEYGLFTNKSAKKHFQYMVLAALSIGFYCYGVYLPNLSYYAAITALLMLTSGLGLLVLFAKNNALLTFKTERSIPQMSIEQLSKLLLDDRLYLQKNINDIAESTSLKLDELKPIINKAGFSSLKEYVNHLRIQVAQELLLDQLDKLTVEGIGKEVGFNSKETFHRVFKAHTGVTPLQFVKNNQVE